MSGLLVNTATIARWTRTLGSDLTYDAPSWSTVATGVACNLQERGARGMATVARSQVQYDAVGYFPPETDLRPDASDKAEGDRVTVGGKIYTVVAVLDQVGRGAFLKALLRRTDR